MSNPSSPTELNAAIQSSNPFSKAGVVREQNVWGTGFPDVTSLNAHASDTVFKALEDVQKSETHKVTSLTLTAQYGVGKTHLISRIRRHLLQENQTLFIYANGDKYADLDLAQYQLQQNIAESLSRTGTDNLMQWQEIAAAMLNEVVKTPKPAAWLTRNFDQTFQKNLKKGKNLMDILCQQVGKKKSNTDPYIIRAILWTLSAKGSSYAIKWLSGNDLDPSHAKLLGLPVNKKTNQDREAEALNFIQQILKLVSQYKSVLICFDEIDHIDKFSDEGFTTPQVIANVIKRLYDTLDNYKDGKGVCLLTVMSPDTWRDSIDSVSSGSSTGLSDRLSTYTQREPIKLNLLKADSMLELVSLWLQDFYQRKDLVPPHSFYPFEEEQLKKYAKTNRPTVREALKWCAENFKIEEEQLPEKASDRFELALSREKEEDFGEFLEDNDLLAEALRFAFSTLVGETIEGETPSGEKINQAIIEEVADVVPKSKNSDWINFKLIGKEQTKEFKIGVSILQHNHWISISAGMGRLINYETFDLTRGCLIRSKDKKIKKDWDAYKQVKQLVKKLGGEWVDLQAEDVKPLIELYSVYQQRDRYDLTEDEIFNYSKSTTCNNPLLLEVLSDPDGSIDESAIETEYSLEDAFEVDEELEEAEEVDPFADSIEDEESEVGGILEEGEEIPDEEIPDEEIPDEEASNTITEEVEQKWYQKNYTGTAINSFTFLGNSYEVQSWKDFFITVCTLIKLRHNKEFSKILELKGKKRLYFSKNPDDLKMPEKITGTNIHVETNFRSQQAVRRVYQIITLFGYDEDSITIEVNEE
ncbi:AAA family ATPase [Spirulina sp. CS-785/01]|uniref:P-loop NTPase fold protein n=1 Tax=Spirulina sp. CS-785/01 TaxID=3021716 RepID=UPI00232E17B8|nr:P-loop NTPase fold protein [Spirulina sp. CS-785/01]MDB9314078.1 AAA family ATPase [Spirulina sp. CS-785/01]